MNKYYYNYYKEKFNGDVKRMQAYMQAGSKENADKKVRQYLEENSQHGLLPEFDYVGKNIRSGK